jgi:uncharacterized membrane protein YciS (DUF1049 family)
MTEIATMWAVLVGLGLLVLALIAVIFSLNREVTQVVAERNEARAAAKQRQQDLIALNADLALLTDVVDQGLRDLLKDPS